MQILCSPGSFNILMRPGALEINNSFLFPSLLYSLPSLTGMEQDQRYWHNREMGGFIYLGKEIPVSTLSAGEAVFHAERKEAFYPLPTHVLPASGSRKAMCEALAKFFSTRSLLVLSPVDFYQLGFFFFFFFFNISRED